METVSSGENYRSEVNVSDETVSERSTIARIASRIFRATVFLPTLLRHRKARFAVYLFAVALVICALHDASTVLVPYLIWMVPGTSVAMLPGEPAALATAQMLRSGNMPVLETALTVGFIGGMASGISAIADHAFLTWVRDHDRVQMLIDHPIAKRVLSLFDTMPFLTIYLFSFLPLPFFAVRVVSIAARYPVERYSLAAALGRFCRYFFIALVGAVYVFPDWVIGGAFVLLVVAFFVVRNRRRSANAEFGNDEL
jgi:membrane protein YqaA with SNARE-associated domain